MNANFDQQQFQTIMNKARQIGANCPNGMTRDEYCQQYIIDHLSNMSQSEAQVIVERIKSGIDIFNRGIDTFATEDGFNHQAAIASLVEGKSQQESFNALVNILLVARVSQFDPSELNTLTDEQLEIFREQIISNREVTDVTIAALQQEAVKVMEEMNIIGVNVPEHVEHVAGDVTELRKFLADSDNTLYAATIAYVESRNGKVDGFKESTPENIGMTVAAGIQEVEVTVQLQEGTIDLPTWAKWIKIIGGVLLWGALLVGSIFLAIFSVLPLCLFVFSLLGSGAIATIIALALALYGSYEVSKFINNYIVDPTLDKADGLYGKLIRWIEEKRQKGQNTESTAGVVSGRGESESIIQQQIAQMQ